MLRKAERSFVCEDEKGWEKGLSEDVTKNRKEKSKALLLRIIVCTQRELFQSA